MVQEIQADEIRDILGFIHQIKDNEISNQDKLNSSLSLFWTVMFSFAGIIDLVLSTSGLIQISFIPWAALTVGGMFYSLVFSRYFSSTFVTQEAIKRYEENKRGTQWVLITIVIIVFSGTLIFTAIGGPDFIMVFLGFILSPILLFIHYKEQTELGSGFSFKTGFLSVHIIWISPLISSLLILIIHAIIGTTALMYAGFSLGLFLALGNLVSFFTTISTDVDEDLRE